MNLKKLLSAIGLLTVAVPSSLSAVACGNNANPDNKNTNKIIEAIDKIKDLQLNLTSKNLDTQVATVLNDPNVGVAQQIAQYSSIPKSYNKSLLKIDPNNIYYDQAGKDQVKPNQKIQLNISYYFKYTYNNVKNKILVPVKVISTEYEANTAIENTQFTLPNLTVGMSVESVKSMITGQWIGQFLDPNIQKIFNAEAFKLEDILDSKGGALTNHDLVIGGTINGKILYTYGTLQHQQTKLTLTLKYTSKDISDAISKSTFTSNVNVDTTVAALKATFTETVIRAKLPEDMQASFDWSKFSLINLNKSNGTKLTDADLKSAQEFKDAKIQFSYDNISSAATLDLSIKYTDQQVADAINKTSGYELNSTVKGNVDDLSKQITSDFVKTKLTGDMQKYFDDDLFKLNKLLNKDGKDLTPADLIAGTVQAQFSFTYGTASGTGSLNINVSYTDQQIADAISDASGYELTSPVQGDVNALSKQITGDFVKTKLTEDMQKHFDNGSFKVTKLTDQKGKELTPADLIAGTVQAQFSFTYNTASGTGSLNINVSYTDQQIADAISKAQGYRLNAKTDDTISSIKNQITANFIKPKLDPVIEKYFNDVSFKVTNLLNKDGNELTPSDLYKGLESGKVEAQFSFTYGTASGTGSIYIHISDLDQTVIDAIRTTPNYALNATVNEDVDILKNQITGDFIKTKLTGDIQKYFDSTAFQLTKLLNKDGKELTPADLKEGKIDATFDFTYGMGSGYGTLTINVSKKDQTMADAISNAQGYELNTTVKSGTVPIYQAITGDFIKNQLSPIMQAKFNPRLFQLFKLTDANGKDLISTDLKEGTVYAKFSFIYGDSYGIGSLTIHVSKPTNATQ